MRLTNKSACKLSIFIRCSKCKVKQYIASGYNTETVTKQTIDAAAKIVGWKIKPYVCCKCQGVSRPETQAHEDAKKAYWLVKYASRPLSEQYKK